MLDTSSDARSSFGMTYRITQNARKTSVKVSANQEPSCCVATDARAQCRDRSPYRNHAVRDHPFITPRKAMKKDTLLTHVGRNPAQSHGTVNTPVFRTSTVVFPDLETYETRDPDDFKSMRYGIHGTPTTFAF